MSENFNLVLEAMEVYRGLTVEEREEVKEAAPEGARNCLLIMDNIIAQETKPVAVYNIPIMSDERWNELAKQNKEARKEVIA